MITLLLLHPLKRNPVQSWSFENESVIRIGRSTDNHVILYSAVVSRHHVELRQTGSTWEIVNLGTNGTYLDGKRITKVPVVDGAIIRLARSGPNIQIRLGTEALKDLPEHLASDAIAGQRIEHHATITEVNDASVLNRERITNFEHVADDGDPPTGTIPVPPHLRIPDNDSPSSMPMSLRTPISVINQQSPSKTISPLHAGKPTTSVPGVRTGFLSNKNLKATPPDVLKSVGNYNILRVLGKGYIGITYLAESEHQSFILKTINADWLNHPKSRAALEMEAELLDQLNSPHIPDLVDFFVVRDRPYLVMEPIQGSSLAQQVKAKGTFPLPQAIAQLLKVCDILSYLHQFVPPVLHRNIEPANFICRDESEELVLIGFGAVKSLILERHGFIGSHGYAAPDQLSLKATPQVDLYGLGPMLAYLLTGKNPVTFCRQQGMHHYQFMADAVTGVSGAVVELMRRLTHVDADDQYPSVESVSHALRELATTA